MNSVSADIIPVSHTIIIFSCLKASQEHSEYSKYFIITQYVNFWYVLAKHDLTVLFCCLFEFDQYFSLTWWTLLMNSFMFNHSRRIYYVHREGKYPYIYRCKCLGTGRLDSHFWVLPFTFFNKIKKHYTAPWSKT